MKDVSKAKGTLRGWTEESARWFDEASAYTGYHDILAGYVRKYLKPEYHCCEIACGTGHLARALAPHVASYTANDMDASAVEFLKKKLGAPGEPKVEVVPGDWRTALPGRRFDAVIISYCGIERNRWPGIMSLAGSRFIAVLPREPRMRMENEEKFNYLESTEDFAEFFDAHGINYTVEPHDIEFGQPFSDMTEARRYVRHYYHLDDSEIDAFIALKVNKSDGMIYFPKVKRINIVAADTSRP